MSRLVQRFVGVGVAAAALVIGPMMGASFADGTDTTATTAKADAPTSAPSEVSASATATVVVVLPTDLQGWTFIDDGSDAVETGTFVDGPTGQPMGTGSVELSAPLTSDRHIVATTAFTGTALSNITALDYWSSQPSGTLAISLQFDIRYRSTDSAYGGRLVYEPYVNVGPVASGWQEWDAFNGGNAKWWSSRTNSAGSNGVCSQSSPCTWSQLLALFPDAQIQGNLLLKAGGGWTGFVGRADALTIGVNGNNTTYDFNLSTPPTTPPTTPPSGPGTSPIVVTPSFGGGAGVGGGATVTTAPVEVAGESIEASPAPDSSSDVEVQGKEATRGGTEKDRRPTTDDSGSGWLWWIIALAGVGGFGWLFLFFMRSRTPGA